MSVETTIGIDLGTSNSCVAVLRNGLVEVIPNEYRETTTPSMVALCKDGTRFVGKEAKNVQFRNLKNTIYESKRLIGRKYSEACIQDRMLHWPFKVVADENDNPKICVTLLTPHRTNKYFHPEEISGMVLEKMKNIAEKHLGCSITKAVITVPAYFNDNQRQATLDAAKIAKLDVLKIINEPTAAAFAYILKNNIEKPCNTLVFDLGGGTFDVSIIHSESNRFSVVAVGGDPDLGGADFDILLYHEIVTIIKKQANTKLVFKTEQKRRIMAACIKVKEQLSDTLTAYFDLPNIIEDMDFEYKFTIQDFDKLVSRLLSKIMLIVKSTLSDAKMSVEDIDNIVLVGGSSRIKAIRKELEIFFKKNVSFAVNPDEAVACGAAYQAAILNKNTAPIVQNTAIVDITPFSLGIEADGQYMDVIIKKNTALPAFAKKKYTTMMDNQTEIRIIIYQGEDQYTSNNVRLSYFDLTGITPAPARVPIIWVTFDINTNGVVHVTATETSSGETVNVKIKINTGRLSDSDFIRIENENEEFSRKQKLMNKIANEKDDLLKFCFKSKRTFEAPTKVNDEDKNDYISNVNTVINFLEHLSINNEEILSKILEKKDDLQQHYSKLSHMYNLD